MENKEANEKLMTAVIRGDIEMAIEALEAGASVHIKTTKGNNLLYVAASRLREEMFDWLLDIEQGGKKIDLNSKNNMGETTLMEFIREDGFFNYIKKILEAGADPNIVKNDGMSPLIQACADKKFDEVQLLIQHKANLDYVIPDTKTTAFLMAASRGSMSICEVLKEAGTNVNALDSHGRNALIAAVTQFDTFLKKKEKAEQKALCLFLSDIGIDINYVAPSGMTALWGASMTKNDELVNHLLDKGANADVWHEVGLDGRMSALHMWINSDNTEIVKKFLANGAKLSEPNESGNTVAAIGFLNPHMRDLMLELKADVNAIVYTEKQTKDQATEAIPVISHIINGGNNQKELVREMISRGAKVSFENEELQPYEPIMVAIKSSAYDIIQDILNTGQVDVNKPIKVKSLDNLTKITPLELTVMGSVNQGFKTFLEKKAQLELLKRAKEENDKNGVKSKIIDDEGMKALEKELEGMNALADKLNQQRKVIFDALLKHGADVNQKNQDERTPIFLCSSEDYVKWLKEAGADLFAEDKDGNNPLLYSVINNKDNVIASFKNEYQHVENETLNKIFYQLAFSEVETHYQQELLQNGIINYVKDEIDIESFRKDKDAIFNVKGINYQDEDGNSPLLVACANDLPFLASLYLKLGADINLKNNNDETPIMHAIATGNDRMVDYLIDKGADLNVCTKDGKTVLEFAQEVENKHILEKVRIGLGENIQEGSISGVKKLKA